MDVELAGEKITYPADGTNELLPPRFINRHKINDNHEHVTLVYFAKSKTDEINQSDGEKSEACRWFTSEELDNKSFGVGERFKAYAKKALEACK